MNPIRGLREKVDTISTSTFLFRDPSQTHDPISSSSNSNEAVIHSVGEFRREEIDGKPFFIFSFLSQTYSPSSSSPEPLFVCPFLRLTIQKLRSQNALHEPFRFDTSPIFSSIGRSDDQQVQNMLDSDIHGGICKYPLVPMFCEEDDDDDEAEYEDEDDDEDDDDDDDDDDADDDDDDDDNDDDIDDDADDHFEYCGACKREILVGTPYYLCDTCCNQFHKECVESPLEIKHPSHPFLSFHLHSVRPYGLGCILCKTSLNRNPMIYLCPTSLLGMHLDCAMKPVPIVINHPKRHLHPLTFFPKQAFLPCNVCGLIDESFPTYVCLPCDFVVHRDCIYFPNVIRMSRHHHRISFTYSLPSRNWSCGVCRKEVDSHYGAYGCNKCDGYFVHSECALRADLWDGKELEGVPEKPEIDVEPFERISDGIIRHFSHDHHHLKLEILRVYNQDKFCQACVLPIYQGNYYSCTDTCDFILHEACASLPLKKYHAFHRHQLELLTSNITDKYEGELEGGFLCGACERISCGFVYECPKKRCGFQLDVRCASVSEPFEYPGHEHPLYLALKPEEAQSALCQICYRCNNPAMFFIRSMLNCIECRYVIICLRCATLPYKARYKHDRHFLTFQEGKAGSTQSDWCDVCESKIKHSKKGGFYSCDECCTTLHVDCLIGKDPYMKPGHTITYLDEEIQILPNNTLSQPFCHVHNEVHLRDRVVFKKRNMIFCSYDCSGNSSEDGSEDNHRNSSEDSHRNSSEDGHGNSSEDGPGNSSEDSSEE